MQKAYKLVPSKKQLKTMKVFWGRYVELQKEYQMKIDVLENNLKRWTNIPDVSFFYVDGEAVGIGNDSRTMKLIHDTELENA